MKCLAFVDLHGSKKKYAELKKKVRKEKPDFLICAGDFTTFEHEVKHHLIELSKMDGYLFLVHGNHEEASVVRRISEQYKKIEFIHGRVVSFHNLILIGWGGGGFTNRDVEFEEGFKAIKKDLKKYKKQGKKLILVTHAPFYGTSLDLLYGIHRGNKSFTKFIKEFKVDYAFCGHLHENAELEDKIGTCRVFNPGPGGIIINI